jgi:type I restriction enzyme, S subunit
MKEGWELCPLGTLCSVIAGQSPEGKFYNSDRNGMPFYQGKKEFGEKFLGEPTTWTTQLTKIAQQKDILMSVRAPVGPINFATEEICIGRGLAAIRPQKNLDGDFLFYQLLHLQPEIAGREGAVFASINKSDIEALEISVTNLQGQRRIVAILDEAFEGIAVAKANAEQNLQNARALFESYLESVFTQRGDGWEHTKLDEVVHSDCTLSYGIVQPGDDCEGGIPVVRPTDLRTKFIYSEGLKRIEAKIADSYRRTKLRGGELLLCVRGTTGVISIATPELEGANVTRGIVPINFNPFLIKQDFGFYLLNSDFVQKQIRSKTYGAALMQINIGDLRNIELSFPPIGQQEEMANKFDGLTKETRRLESIYRQKIAALDELKKSLLHEAFSGRL